MSGPLTWLIIRNNNAFLSKKANIKKPFSREPNNLTNLNSYRYNGLIHKKLVGIEAPAKTTDKKGFVFVMKKAAAWKRPGSNLVRTEMKSGPRRSLHKLRRILRKNKYRKDLAKAALRRASAVLRAQRPAPPKKPGKKTE